MRSVSWRQPDTVGASSSPLAAMASPLAWAVGPCGSGCASMLVVSCRSVVLCARWVVAWIDIGVVGGCGSRWLVVRPRVGRGREGGQHALLGGAPPPGLVAPQCRGEGEADQDPGRCGDGHRDPAGA